MALDRVLGLTHCDGGVYGVGTTVVTKEYVTENVVVIVPDPGSIVSVSVTELVTSTGVPDALRKAR